MISQIQVGDKVLVAWDQLIADTGRVYLKHSRAYIEDMALEVTKIETSAGFLDCIVEIPHGTKMWVIGNYLHKIY